MGSHRRSEFGTLWCYKCQKNHILQNTYKQNLSAVTIWPQYNWSYVKWSNKTTSSYLAFLDVHQQSKWLLLTLTIHSLISISSSHWNLPYRLAEAWWRHQAHVRANDGNSLHLVPRCGEQIWWTWTFPLVKCSTLDIRFGAREKGTNSIEIDSTQKHVQHLYVWLFLLLWTFSLVSSLKLIR